MPKDAIVQSVEGVFLMTPMPKCLTMLWQHLPATIASPPQEGAFPPVRGNIDATAYGSIPVDEGPISPPQK
jgi:hypothetical protein